MFKIIVVLLCAFGASLYFPNSRAVVLEFLAPALNPVLTWQTNGEMKQIARELQTMDREGQPLPTEGKDFDEWMGRNFQGGSRMDGWGNPYTLRVWRDSAGVYSKGPDLTAGTADDIVQTARTQNQARWRRR